MKKIFSLSVVLLCLVMNVMATTAFDFNSKSCLTQTKNGYSVTIEQAGEGNTKPQYYNDEARLYANNTITVSGEGITRIHIVFTKQGSKQYAELTTSVGELISGGISTSGTDKKTDTWEGSANSVVFKLGNKGQRIIKQLVINGDSTDINSGKTDKDTTITIVPSSLDSNYIYSEPTEIVAQGKQSNNQPYSFIQNNIKVDCTKGAIDTTDHYFGCNAEHSITFTASREIKGLTINGYAKKAFSATSDKGNISFMTDSEDAVTGDPVLVITDINSQSVTIACDKQLRCYSVKFYFEANPTDSIGSNDNGDGEYFFFTYDAADAVYESAITEIMGEINYSIFLHNADSEFPYIALDLYPTEEGDLTGIYSMDIYTMGEETYYQFGADQDNDFSYATEGMVTINKSGNTYSISGFITCEDNNTYNFTFTGEMPFYTDTDYYDYDDEAIEVAYPPLNPAAKMHDILGRPVGRNYRGIIIQDGHKYLVR
ncbi:MAG: hypothetical protein K6A36_07665 [Paludibacteraceae bacterium]|nr:hypothetical protein [Paludibacteraceae bacterium]